MTTTPPTTVDELERALLSIAQRHLSGREVVQATPRFIREAAAVALEWAAGACVAEGAKWRAGVPLNSVAFVCDDLRTRAAALRSTSTGGG